MAAKNKATQGKSKNQTAAQKIATQDETDDKNQNQASATEGVPGDGGDQKPGQKSPPPDENKETVPSLSVYTRRKGGRRRAGYAFSQEPLVIPVDKLTKAAREAIKSDPVLVVEEIE